MQLERIILDARAWHGRPGGIGTYTRALVARLPQALPDVEFLLLRHRRGPSTLSAAPNVRVLTLPGMPHGPITLLLRPRIPFRPGDLYHSLFPVIPLGISVPVVVTVHDLMWFHSPKLVSESALSGRLEQRYQHAVVSYSVKRARRILCNSHCTREDLVRLWPDLADKVRVTPFAPSPMFTDGAIKPDRSRVRKFVPAGARFFLVVGNGSRNKNHETAVRAFARAFRDAGDVHLVVIQRSRLGLPRFRREVEESGVASRIHLFGAVEDADVVSLMTEAVGFIFPSRYEGFGLPILEAMAAECPVLCSNSASLPEVAGDAALLYAPEDADGFAEGMRKILADGRLRNELIERGRRRVGRFTWERCVEETIRAYSV